MCSERWVPVGGVVHDVAKLPGGFENVVVFVRRFDHDVFIVASFFQSNTLLFRQVTLREVADGQVEKSFLTL